MGGTFSRWWIHLQLWLRQCITGIYFSPNSSNRIILNSMSIISPKRVVKKRIGALFEKLRNASYLSGYLGLLCYHESSQFTKERELPKGSRHMCVRLSIHPYPCIHLSMYVELICVYIHIHVCMCVCMCIYPCVWGYLRVNTCVYICIYIYTLFLLTCGEERTRTALGKPCLGSASPKWVLRGQKTYTQNEITRSCSEPPP